MLLHHPRFSYYFTAHNQIRPQCLRITLHLKSTFILACSFYYFTPKPQVLYSQPFSYILLSSLMLQDFLCRLYHTSYYLIFISLPPISFLSFPLLLLELHLKFISIVYFFREIDNHEFIFYFFFHIHYYTFFYNTYHTCSSYTLSGPRISMLLLSSAFFLDVVSPLLIRNYEAATSLTITYKRQILTNQILYPTISSICFSSLYFLLHSR